MATEFSIRSDRFISELRYRFLELYPEGGEAFAALQLEMKNIYKERSAALKRRDRNALDNPEWYRRSSLQARLIEDGCGFSGRNEQDNYVNYTFSGDPEKPEFLLKALKELLALANSGVEVIRLEGIPELFRIPGGDWQHQQRLHSLLRIIRIVFDIICPSTLLCGDVEGDTTAVSGYFGSLEKPELHLMEDANFIPTLWQTIATADTRLLAYEISKEARLPKFNVFMRSFENPKGFYWNLDYDFLEILKMDKDSHLDFLKKYFSGKFKGSPAKAKVVRERKTGRISVRGSIEELAGAENAKKVEELLQAYLLIMSGIPEAEDDGEVRRLLKWRKLYHVFDCGADVWTMTTDNDSVIGVGRYKEGQKIYGLYNFSNKEQIFSLHDPGLYENLINGKTSRITSLVRLQPYAYAWLVEKHED